MLYFLLKALLTGLAVAAISEISKRSTLIAAVLASLPLTSILAFIWMDLELPTAETAPIQELSYGIFWMVLPSLAFFLILPAVLKIGVRFYPSLAISCVAMAVLYFGYVRAVGALGLNIAH